MYEFIEIGFNYRVHFSSLFLYWRFPLSRPPNPFHEFGGHRVDRKTHYVECVIYLEMNIFLLGILMGEKISCFYYRLDVNVDCCGFLLYIVKSTEGAKFHYCFTETHLNSFPFLQHALPNYKVFNEKQRVISNMLLRNFKVVYIVECCRVCECEKGNK